MPPSPRCWNASTITSCAGWASVVGTSLRRLNSQHSQACPPNIMNSPNSAWRVSTDYHVEFQSFFYSVPHAVMRSQVYVRTAERMMEIFHRSKRIAVHQQIGRASCRERVCQYV